MKSIADNLAVAAQLVKDDDLILYILSGLGPDFNTLVVSVTSRVEAISIADLHGLLLSHETRLESLNLIEEDLDEVEVVVVVVDIIWVMVNLIIPRSLLNVNLYSPIMSLSVETTVVMSKLWLVMEQDRATGKVLLEGRLEDDLYKLLSIGRSDLRSFNKPQAFLVTKPSLDVWHIHLGHPSIKVIQSVGNVGNQLTHGQFSQLVQLLNQANVTQPDVSLADPNATVVCADATELCLDSN
ncbi:hypothetical protein KY290_036369 [Solanum tuberosum]|uniref:GAG-pre-integrase domain-containing protein n=1 Tax=Solanum tuberosum TaxID=4113 RepID=A0ABQ7TSG1_SOLTU|nr:hypothetical protein KY285_035654 [Solanum tuberosum]KAH0737664.1 hypothetical protein KY290_036369 [Solanum tuberosum]